MSTENESATGNQPNTNFNDNNWVVFWIVLAIIVLGVLAYAVYKPGGNTDNTGSPAVTESSSTANPNAASENSSAPENSNSANMANPNAAAPSNPVSAANPNGGAPVNLNGANPAPANSANTGTPAQ